MITTNEIDKAVCEYFQISVESLHSKSRKREIVQTRQIAMYFSKQFTEDSLASIGHQIGSKNHATVLHACKTVKNLIDTDKKFKEHCDNIERIIKSEKNYNMDTSIKDNYEKSVQLYVDKFCSLNNIEFDFWVGSNVGGVAAFGDYFFNFSDIKYAVDNEICFNWVSDWHEFNVSFGEKCSIDLIDYIKLRELSDNDLFDINEFEKKILYSRIK